MIYIARRNFHVRSYSLHRLTLKCDAALREAC
jgi:hypothetical protein